MKKEFSPKTKKALISSMSMSSAIRIIIFTIVVFGILRVSDNPSNREITEWIMVGFALFILYLADKAKSKERENDENLH